MYKNISGTDDIIFENCILDHINKYSKNGIL